MLKFIFTPKILGIILGVIFVACIAGCRNSKETEDDVMSAQIQQGEPIVTHIFTADPSAHVFNNKLYIYPSHDPREFPTGASSDDGGQYLMVDYHVLSMDINEGTCTDHGVALELSDIPWASKQLWAPDAAYKDGIYYFYFPAKDKDGIFRIGVATSSKPEGPFTPEENYIEGSFSIDPAVFVDTDDKA